jgi:hypothetical protein
MPGFLFCAADSFEDIGVSNPVLGKRLSKIKLEPINPAPPVTKIIKKTLFKNGLNIRSYVKPSCD